MTNYSKKLESLKETLNELMGKASGIEKFSEFIKVADATGKLDSKTKLLMSLAIAITVRCESCIMWYTDALINSEVTEEEIIETIKIAVVMGGGPALMYGLKAYEIALEFLGKK